MFRKVRRVRGSFTSPSNVSVWQASRRTVMPLQVLTASDWPLARPILDELAPVLIAGAASS